MSVQVGQPERLIAGAMSGTSADGVDVAIVRIAGRGLEMSAKLVKHGHVPYNPGLRQLIFAARESGSIRLGDLAKMGRDISLVYAQAVNQTLADAQLKSSDLACVAAHGQTLFHEPPNTIQWFDPALVAAEVGCAVVSDFRRADCAAGGQGAPLVPFADYILFRHPTKNRVLLNIGGIANITWLKAGGSIEDVIAFDTGPGNCVSDWICRTRGPFNLSWDVDGQGASRGKVIPELDASFRSSSYFQRGFPKSTDGTEMLAIFEEAIERSKTSSASFNDLLATAAYLTAKTVSDAVRRLPGGVDQVLASGGGIRNKAIMGWLGTSFDAGTVLAPWNDCADFASDAKEAVAFALIAAATLDDAPSNIPSVTGAARPVILGSVTPKP